jgi:hypothetical protein
VCELRRKLRRSSAVVATSREGHRLPRSARAGLHLASAPLPVGRFGYLEVVDASDVLDNAVACVVSDVHAEGKTFAQDAQLKSIAACRTIAQCLNLEHEIHDTASKLCILGFEPLK